MKATLAVVFALFAALNVYALVSSGMSGLVAAMTQGNAWNTVFGIDLVISLGLVLAWLWQDARKHGRSPLPYFLITAFTGSIGPLLYLLGRPAGQSK